MKRTRGRCHDALESADSHDALMGIVDDGFYTSSPTHLLSHELCPDRIGRRLDLYHSLVGLPRQKFLKTTVKPQDRNHKSRIRAA